MEKIATKSKQLLQHWLVQASNSARWPFCEIAIDVFYERGVQPLVPIDLAKSLSSPGKRRHDEAPTP
eukprot:SAG11_NODE_20665_length_440_cov_7.721408_1_plen_66_part_10